jgi:hypothetical protein
MLYYLSVKYYTRPLHSDDAHSRLKQGSDSSKKSNKYANYISEWEIVKHLGWWRTNPKIIWSCVMHMCLETEFGWVVCHWSITIHTLPIGIKNLAIKYQYGPCSHARAHYFMIYTWPDLTTGCNNVEPTTHFEFLMFTDEQPGVILSLF